MAKCVVLIGHMCSGKTALSKFLELQGYKRIVTYTTRPPRDGEIDGIDYHFISENEFEWKKSIDFFAEVTSYNATFGYCMYGSAKEDYRQSGKSVIVLNAQGVLQINEPACFVWLDLPRRVLVDRARRRGDTDKEILWRIDSDAKDFLKMANELVCDIRVTEEMPVQHLAKIIDRTNASQNLLML